jgi:hypothetical protein
MKGLHGILKSKNIEVIFKNYVLTSYENTQFLHYKDQLVKAL